MLLMTFLTAITWAIFGLAASAAPGKHWKRATVRGAFDVNAYAYNKPIVNLVDQLPRTGQALPMGQLLEQIAHSSRARAAPVAEYRNLDKDIPAADSLDPVALATLNSQLAKLQMNLTLQQPKLYSNEFQVQDKGKKKIVLINTLQKVNEGAEDAQKQGSADITKQQSPLNVKLALPEMTGEGEEATAMPKLSDFYNQSRDTAAISPATESVAFDVTTIEKESTGAEPNPQPEEGAGGALTHPLQPSQSPVDVAKKRDSKNDIDGPAQGMNTSPEQRPDMGARAGTEAALDKPLPVKSKRKRTQTRTKAKTKTKTATPNVTDPKSSTAASNPPAVAATAASPANHQLMKGQTADVKATANKLQKGNQPGQMVAKGAKRRGSQRRPSPSVEQEIETEANWWQILPYAEIRKFLNTIYDSIADDEADNERAQRM